MSVLSRKHLGSLAVLLGLAWCVPAVADAPAARASGAASAKKTDGANYTPSKFFRLKRDAKEQPVALETALVRYAAPDGKKKGVTVDLIGVVHVGDRDYYEKLNKAMDQYDVLLYELVAPQGTRVPKGGRKNSSNNPLSMMQGMMKSMLQLESQLDHIDYTRKNFVHADMSPDELSQAMQKRGETPFTLFLSAFADSLKQQNLQMQKKGANKAADDIDLLGIFFDPQAPLKLKRLMAEQLESVEGPTGGLGASLNNLLIVDRNKAALKVLERELAKGHKRIGIFYGAAHMPDFESRLVNEFGLRPQSQQWFRAWDMQMRNNAPAGGGLGDILKGLGQ